MPDTPDWYAAAHTLINGFHALDNHDERVRLTEKLCDKLSGDLYPAFLQILYNIEQHADNEAKSLLTNTLIYGLNTGRLPSGKLSAWGSNTLSADSAFGQTRTLGPIEYLCTWYSQPSGQPPLTRAAFVTIATSLLRLIESDSTAKSLYCVKLSEDAEDPLSGSLSAQTRAGLTALAASWQAGQPAEVVVESYIDSIQGSSLLEELSLDRFPGGGGFPAS